MERWAWWSGGGEAVRVVGEEELWGTAICDVVSEASGRLHRVPADALHPLRARTWHGEEVAWRAAAARALALAAAGEPLATRGGRVELLPHQLGILERALEMDPVRLAVCCMVGLGKTITAGAIATELKARGRANRILVVAPKGVQLQWVAEMADRFGEEFVRVGPEGVPVDAGVDPWRAFDQVVCSLDAVKPVRARAGWVPDRVREYNRIRSQALIDAGWDLVIFDEAHRVAGSTEDVARHRLARELSQAAEHCLALSATPHSGKSDAFRRFCGIVDDRFLHGLPIQRETVGPILARTEQRVAVDNAGRPLFTARSTRLEIVPYGGRGIERALYEAVTDYVREGWGRAQRERRPAVGFLVLLMQRLVSSSTAAIRTALERRAATLDDPAESELRFGVDPDDWPDLTGEEQLEALASVRGVGWAAERAEVERLLHLAREAESEGPDAKALFVLDLLRRLAREEGDPQIRLLLFTQFRPTQEMLLSLFADAGINAVAINGTMGLAERALAQEAFRGPARVLVSTDAGGEGINLQFAHLVANYDMPWAPTVVEQRLGRVSRIGQQHPVRAFNLVMENSIDARVLEVLEEKLATILAEFGSDARDDVLETTSATVGDVYAEALGGDDALTRAADALMERTRADLRENGDIRDLLRSDVFRPTTTGDQLRVALDHAVAARGAMGHEVADPLDALIDLPTIAPGEPVPRITGPIMGWWSCWDVRPDASGARTAFALFSTDTDSIRPDLADDIWDTLAAEPAVVGTVTISEDEWQRILNVGRSYAYTPCEQLAGGSVPAAPSVRPLLIVRVDS